MDYVTHITEPSGNKVLGFYRQACFGEMALGIMRHKLSEMGFISAVEYVLHDNEALPHLIELANLIKLEGIRVGTVGTISWGDAGAPRGFSNIPKNRITLYIPVADLPINVAMYKLFAIRNADRYLWGENRHPYFMHLFNTGVLSLIETVAFSNLFKEAFRFGAASPEITNFQAHHMYNSLLIQDKTTVADFRRFLKDPSDLQSEVKMATFRKAKTGYPRTGDSYICTAFQTPWHKRHHKTSLIYDYSDRKFHREYDHLYSVKQFEELGNYLLGRKAFKDTASFRKPPKKAV